MEFSFCIMLEIRSCARIGKVFHGGDTFRASSQNGYAVRQHAALVQIKPPNGRPLV
jgi:hypothetical protein